MRQSILTVVLDVDPASATTLRDRISALRVAQETLPGRTYGALLDAVPTLHFMAITVFEDAAHDPILMLEANCDGTAGPFFAQLEAAIGDALRDFLRCCKPPRDASGTMFARIVAPGSRQPIAPFLEARLVTPTYGHQGNRGLDRPRIAREAALFQATQAAIDADRPALAALPPPAIQATLRKTLLPQFPWLNETPEPRIGGVENVLDWLRFGGFLLLVLALLALPWWLVFGWPWAPIAAVIATVAIVFGNAELRGMARGAKRPATALLGIAALLTLAGIVPTLLLVLVWVRRLEQRDPSQDAPPVNAALLAAMAEREDRVVQNHMGSVVTVKPGLLRAVILRVALLALALVIRVLPDTRRGYLGSMRTIHFAHWSVLANGGRLLFVSNFDGTWESYLDDFIEKAHGGLTLAWNGCIGFPAARFLVLDGATAGRKFKAWARHSMAPTLFWVSAYPEYTVDEIERHAEVAVGLRQTSMTAEEAAAWCLKL